MECATRMTPTSRSLGGHGFSDRSLRMSITSSRILESMLVSRRKFPLDSEMLTIRGTRPWPPPARRRSHIWDTRQLRLDAPVVVLRLVSLGPWSKLK